MAQVRCHWQRHWRQIGVFGRAPRPHSRWKHGSNRLLINFPIYMLCLSVHCFIRAPSFCSLTLEVGSWKPQSTITFYATQWAALASRQAKSFAYGGLVPPGTDWDIHCIKVTWLIGLRREAFSLKVGSSSFPDNAIAIFVIEQEWQYLMTNGTDGLATILFRHLKSPFLLCNVALHSCTVGALLHAVAILAATVG